VVLVEPRLTDDEDAVGVRLRGREQTAEVPNEMLEHWRGIPRGAAQSGRTRAHRSRLADPPAGVFVDLHRPEPSPSCATRQFPDGERARRPAECRFRMAPEYVADADGRDGSGRALLEPAQHIRGANHDDEELQPRIPWQHARENQIERLGADAGAGNAADVHA